MITPEPISLRFAGLFAGIGGIELGLSTAGHKTDILVENAKAASHVLLHHFPDVKMEADVRHMGPLPSRVNAIAAGFPCQDLSSSGLKVGIEGDRSSLVSYVLEILETMSIDWLLLENVPFLLSLNRGEALHRITARLSELGYRWAYRIVDSMSFGLPQRRNRWYLLASRVEDPKNVLLSDNVSRPAAPADDRSVASGFYWTEGYRSFGWTPDGTPPIKCGSSVGVASPPAIRLPTGGFITPHIRDAERLQGFPADWTHPAEEVARPGERWRLVGNAVSVPAAAWIGQRLAAPGNYDASRDVPLIPGAKWPRTAAWADHDGTVHVSTRGPFPIWTPRPPLSEFLREEGKPLSKRAAAGFLTRAERGSLRFPTGFLAELADYVEAS